MISRQKPHRKPAHRATLLPRSKAPSFKGFAPSSKTASRTKQRNRATNTQAELALRRALTKHGLRYRLHARDLPGKPDVVFRRERVVVFCDGDFWHGRGWRTRLRKLEQGSNADYWVQKIRANMLRDRRHTRALGQLGWTVIRVWETNVRRDPDAAVQLIATAVRGCPRSP
jgi:DNA mismatch endonuclease (patch repair protein)